MKKWKLSLLSLSLAALLGCAALAGTAAACHHHAARSCRSSVPASLPSACAFVDADGDGICDNVSLHHRYTDDNGDGACDLHCAAFLDKDSDGLCDSCAGACYHSSAGCSRNGSCAGADYGHHTRHHRVCR